MSQYKVGDFVAYGLHGKCVITSIETKELGGERVNFYQMRAVKNTPIPRPPTPRDPFILIPIERASEKGLRSLMTKEEAEQVLHTLASPAEPENFGNDSWVHKQKKLEEVIRKEGAIGLAKVVAHLYITIKRDAVPPSDVMKFYENIYRILAREMAESMGIVAKDLEPLLQKALKNRLAYEM